VEITDALVRSAGRYAERHALRGFDAMHLAAATQLRGAGETVEFGCFDGALNRAARREKLSPLAPGC